MFPTAVAEIDPDKKLHVTVLPENVLKQFTEFTYENVKFATVFTT